MPGKESYSKQSVYEPKILLTLKIKIEIEINSKENQFLKIQNTAPYHGVNHNCKARDLWRTFLINCAQTSSVTTSAWKPCFLVHFSHVFVEHRAAKLKPEPTSSHCDKSRFFIQKIWKLVKSCHNLVDIWEIALKFILRIFF